MNELIDKLKEAALELRGKNIIYITKNGAKEFGRELGVTIDQTKKEQTIGNLTIHIVE